MYKDILRRQQIVCIISSVDTPALIQRASSTKFGERAFNIAGPKVWNTLQRELRDKTSLSAFKRDLNLKTHLCGLAYES